MPYDPNRKLFLPDFQSNVQAPDWVDMGQQDTQGMGQDVGKIGASFKERLMSGGGEGKGEQMSGAAGKSGGASSAMKSLG